jgi:integral membrane sensor domain MASE1
LKWAVAATCLAAYVLLAWISFIHVHKGLPVTPWDPGLGVVSALMIFAGPQAGSVLFAGVVIAEVLVLQHEVEWPIIFGIAAITSLSYTAVPIPARQTLEIDIGLFHLRDVLMLLAVGFAGAVIDTVLLTLFLLAVGELDFRDIVQVFSPLLIGDMIGIAVVTPLLLRFVFRQRRIALRELISIAPEGVLYLMVIGAALWAINGSESLHGFRLFYLLFVPVVIAAVRHGLDGACFSLAITQFGLIGLLRLSGYDAAQFTEFQAQMLVLTVTGLIVGVVVSERESSDRLARDAQARLMEKQAGAAHAARLNLVSGMASALAHEIPTDDRCPCIGAIRAAHSARPRRRSDPGRRPSDNPAGAHRSCRRHRAPYARFHAPGPPACEHDRHAQHAGGGADVGICRGLRQTRSS